MIKLAIIIPAHNEERRIGKTLEAYISFFRNQKSIKDFEIIVVINGCKDNTRKIVEQHKTKEIKIMEFERGAKGFAVIAGFKEALKDNCELIGFVDADMATNPEAFFDLIKNINGYSGIIASRYIKGSIINPKPSLRRRIVSRMYNMLIRTIFLIPYRDTQCGAKLFKSLELRKVIPRLGMSQWGFDLDVIYNFRKLGYQIKEFPTSWSDKEYSTINFMKSGPLMVLGVIRLRILNSPVKNFVKTYDKITRLIARRDKKIY